VQGDVTEGMQGATVTAALLPGLREIEARWHAAGQGGYRIEVAGAVEESSKGSASIAAGIPIMLFITFTLLMLQLHSFSRAMLVFLTGPLGLAGVAGALLLLNRPFGFVALLGVIALMGMIQRNSVILIDQIEQDRARGVPAWDAIVESAVRRLRPIVLTAAAAVLAMIPLSRSVFWGPMAVAIMGGLVVATSAASGMDQVPIVKATKEGSRFVAAIPDGPTLTWYPDGNGEIPDASSYYPDHDGLQVSSILVRPISEAPDSEMETFPATSEELQDCIITFPIATGIAPLYLVYSKPPVRLLEVDTYRNFQGRPRLGAQADHMPSAAAIALFLRNSPVKIARNEINSRKKDVAALIVPAWVHQKCSETYGGRNAPEQIEKDAKDLKAAVDNNMNTIKGCLKESGFNEEQIENARQEMHQVNREQGWYK
jgi:hypothetical protein